MQQVFIAKTLEEAKQEAAASFGVEESLISFTVIEEPKKGIFGKIKGEFKVEASYEPPKTKGHVAADYVREILKELEVVAEVEVSEVEGGAVIEISGEGIGVIIGRRGETIDSIQYLASMACNKGDKDYYRITVDSCGYREKRKKTLEELAVKIANNVKRTGKTSALEPMNPYERRIIHSAVSEVEGVTSRSTGEEPYRKVIIASTNPKARSESGRNGSYRGGKNGGNRNRGGRRNDEYKRGQPPREMDLKTSFEKDYKKPKPEDALTTGLYGKIEF